MEFLVSWSTCDPVITTGVGRNGTRNMWRLVSSIRWATVPVHPADAAFSRVCAHRYRITAA